MLIGQKEWDVMGGGRTEQRCFTESKGLFNDRWTGRLEEEGKGDSKIRAERTESR